MMMPVKKVMRLNGGSGLRIAVADIVSVNGIFENVLR